MDSRVGWDAAADRLALRIRKNGPSSLRMRNAGPKAPASSTFAGQADPSLMLGDLSRVGRGGGLPRIASLQTGALNTRVHPKARHNPHVRRAHHDRTGALHV